MSKSKEDNNQGLEIKKDNGNSENSSSLELLNQPFILWFLSTVVIGFFTFSYNYVSQEIKSEKEKSERILELDLEFASRVGTLNNLLAYRSSASEYDDFDQDNFSKIFITMMSDVGILQLQGQRDTKSTSQKRTLTSLLWELSELVSDNEREDVIEALSIVGNLNELGVEGTFNMFDSFGGGAESFDVDSMQILIEMLLEIERWKVLSSNNVDIKKEQEKIWDSVNKKLKELEEKKAYIEAEEERRYEEERAKEELSDQDKMDMAKKALLYVNEIDIKWVVKEYDDAQGNRVYLQVQLTNSSNRTIDHFVADIDVFDQKGSRIVSTWGVKNFSRVTPGAVFTINDRMDIGARTRSLSNYSLSDFNSMKVIVYPRELVFENGEMEEFPSITNINLLRIYDNIGSHTHNNRVN